VQRPHFDDILAKLQPQNHPQAAHERLREKRVSLRAEACAAQRAP
jgi:hypothetical protein